MANNTDPLRTSMREVLMEPAKSIIVELATNNLILEQDKIGFLTKKRTETDFLTYEKSYLDGELFPLIICKNCT